MISRMVKAKRACPFVGLRGTFSRAGCVVTVVIICFFLSDLAIPIFLDVSISLLCFTIHEFLLSCTRFAYAYYTFKERESSGVASLLSSDEVVEVAIALLQLHQR